MFGFRGGERTSRAISYLSAFNDSIRRRRRVGRRVNEAKSLFFNCRKIISKIFRYQDFVTLLPESSQRITAIFSFTRHHPALMRHKVRTSNNKQLKSWKLGEGPRPENMRRQIGGGGGANLAPG